MTTFQTPEPIALAIELGSADITVIASDRTDTIVEVKPADAAKKADVRAAEQTEVSFADGTVSVKAPKNWRAHAPFGGNPSLAVTVRVPSGSQVNAHAAVGHLVGIGPLGDSELELSMGTIVVEQPQGSVTAKIAKGDIHIGEAARGVLRLEVSTGEIEVGIHPGSAARLETNTPKGAVHNQLAPAAGAQDTVDIQARNACGNITIRNTVTV
ncbi:DUF4097 family beta strand repeat-containing protein [Nocardia sp. JMUB6875]|uniref:hypothetical protein n=1 Tax=Nocardia sp. JMUB6875 TaxID=3158170 RepID=UPI0032E63155